MQKNNYYEMFMILGMVALVVLMAGIYTILNGKSSPGGGFQGGALLAAAYIIRYLIHPVNNLNLKKYQLYEKVLLILVIVSGISFVTFHQGQPGIWAKDLYLYWMNLLIGLKVFCGFVVIFERFVFYEVR